MNNLKFKQKNLTSRANDPNQRGSAIVIAVFVLVLVSVFVALALSRTAAEGAAMGNETAEGRTFYAAQGSLESMTRNFNKVFEVKLNPSDADFTPVRNGAVPGITGYDFNQEVLQTSSGSDYRPIEDGAYAGLYALRDNWRLRTTATDASGIQVQLARNIVNNRIPIFQFGIFYNDDMELHPGARFDFGGRVHSNGSMFLMSSAGIYFSSRVSAVGEIITDINRNNKTWNGGGWGEQVFIKNGNTNVQLLHDKGSALSTPANGTALFRDPTKSNYNPDMPTVYNNAGWDTSAATFGGNLLARQKSLDLPLKIAASNRGRSLDYVEIIKRGKNIGDLHNTDGTPTSTPYPVTADKADSDVTATERYYNKTGLRISIADSKAELPGCASGVGTAATTDPCGVRLDGASVKPAANAVWGAADANGSHGYQPLPMSDGYQATRLNGERFRTSAGEVWIKVEMVSKDPVTNAINTVEVTEDILSLGVTEVAPFASSISGYVSGGTAKDSRSIIKLQRFAIPGNVGITQNDNPNTTFLPIGGTNYNVVKVAETAVVAGVLGAQINTANDDAPSSPVSDKVNHAQSIFVPTAPLVPNTGTQYSIVPFPIEMFDAREGLYNTDTSVFNAATTYGTNVPWMGVMSMVDIDVSNLKTFLEGGFNSAMPTGTKFYAGNTPNRKLASTDVPQNGGWVVYLSDRRGDSDFDGEYDMEDVFGRNDGVKQTGEDVNKNNLLDVNYASEAVKYVAGGLFTAPTSMTTYGSYVSPGYAATMDHPFYRRGVRLINGTQLPGTYNSANSSLTRGFTFASENGVYVQGNYNATGINKDISGNPLTSPTLYSDYLPIGAADVPASVVGDAVYVLSNAWTDARSFRYPYTPNDRQATETYTRFAMIAGDPLSSLLVTGEPNQGGSDARLSGGVHNFKRYLENWGSSIRLNYCGSLINLYNSRNNSGTQKSGGVYGAPARNWVFDSSFLDPTRLPPGTPYFQFVQTSGFQRTND